MSLSLIFRLSAGYIGIWVLMMAFAPSMVASDTLGVDLTTPLRAQMQITALAALTVAIFNWTVTMWAIENMAKFGRVAAYVWAAFALLNLYFLADGVMLATAQNYSSPIIMGLLAVLFFMKSKD
ncbi:MAG: hypothetical protein NZ738_11395 [Oceanospirillaceae bacterium]|nr:hypothetical protein [Oceanospirillaceae bacterium]